MLVLQKNISTGETCETAAKAELALQSLALLQRLPDGDCSSKPTIASQTQVPTCNLTLGAQLWHKGFLLHVGQLPLLWEGLKQWPSTPRYSEYSSRTPCLTALPVTTILTGFYDMEAI